MSEEKKVPETSGYIPTHFNYLTAECSQKRKGYMYCIKISGIESTVFIPDGASKLDIAKLVTESLKNIAGAAHHIERIINVVTNQHVNTQPNEWDPATDVYHDHAQKCEPLEDKPKTMKWNGRRELMKTKSGFTYPKPKTRR